jgi:valyl-tRNA synthetase
VETNHDVLLYVLETILALAHPVAPYVTEAIWSHLPGDRGLLISAAWPVATKKRALPKKFEQIRELVMAARSLCAEEQLSKPTLLTNDHNLLEAAAYLQSLARLGAVQPAQDESGFYLGASAPAWIAATPEQISTRRRRLEAQQSEKQKYAAALKAKLANEQFVAHAPQAIITDTRTKLAETQELITKLEQQLNNQ